MADSIYTFDPVAANNTSLDTIPYGPNQLYHNQIDNWFRALGAKLAQHVDDLGGVNTVAGTANAITVDIASGITAYATGQMFWFKNTVGPNTTATFINVNSIGSKEIRLQGDTALSGGEMLDNGYYGLLYDAAYDGAAGGFVLLNPEVSTSITFATNAQALAASSTTLSLNPANLATLIQNINNNAFNIADLQGVRLNMAGGIADAYDSETDVDTATSTNESYDAANDLYSPTGTSTRISGGTPTMPLGGTAANINDNNTGTSATTSGIGDLNAAAINSRIMARIDYGANKTITKIETIGLSYSGGSTTLGGFYYSTDGTSWTQLGVDISVTGSAANYDRTGSVTARYVAVILRQTNWAGTTVTLQDLNGYEDVASNMTLVSNAFTATAVPTQARVAVFIDPQVSITINTDFTAEVSRDGGTTWTAVTLAIVSNPVGTVEQYEGTVSISAQPSGTSMKYRLKTLNNKDIDVTGVVFQWS